MSRIDFINIRIDNLTSVEALKRVDQMIQEGGPHYVVTPNVDHMVRLDSDTRLQKVYASASMVLTDGMPLIWASRLFGTPIVEKVSGADFMPMVCDYAARTGRSIYLLGAGPGVAQKAAGLLEQRYPGLRVAGVYSPPFGFDTDPVELDKTISLVREAKPDILILGMGNLKQEYFIHEFHEALQVPVSLCTGASIDFIAGIQRRAPVFMQRMGLEWFYRLMNDPKRLYRRYLIEGPRILPIFYKGYKLAKMRKGD